MSLSVPRRLAAKVVAQQIKPKVRHYLGFPRERGSSVEGSEKLPSAAVLLIGSEADGVFLYRIASDGRFGGDTWHPSLEEAQQQATFEFGSGLSAWLPVPEDIDDVVAFCLSSEI